MRIPADFIIGTSSSAWQIEGSQNKINKSWADLFYETNPELWFNKIGPSVACDFINHYQEDIKLMSEAGMNTFRFTIQWPYFLKDIKTGVINDEAYYFYLNVIKTIKKYHMKPFVSLEHWDIPAEFIEEFDGWCSRKMIEYYELYASKVFEAYANEVEYFFAFTEPNIPIDNGYMDKLWYPFKHNPKKAYQAHFHKTLATARIKELIKPYQEKFHNKLGVMIHYTPVYARSDSKQDQKAKDYADLLQVRLYLDPYLKGEYSKEYFKVLKDNNCMFTYFDDDLKIIKQNRIDILGLDYYFPLRVKVKESEPNQIFHPENYYDKWVKPDRIFNADRGWEVYPQAILDSAKRIDDEYDNFPFFISENGIGIANEQHYRNQEGYIDDDYRINFLSQHLKYALKAYKKYHNCHGYLIWSYIDNLSAINAFKNRYGLIELDLTTYKRIPKKSYYYFKRINELKEIN